MPFPDAGRLVVCSLTRRAPDGRSGNLRWSYPQYELLRHSASSFESITSFTFADVNLTAPGEAERLVTEIVSASYFETLGLAPALGRSFVPEEDARPGTHPVALIGHRLWESRFGSGEVLGRTLRVNGKSLTVIGVAPRGFAGLSGRADLWIPTMMAPTLTYGDYLTTNQNFVNVVARVKRHASPIQVEAELAALGSRIARAHPTDWPGPAEWSGVALPLNEARVDPANRRALLLLLGATLCVLLLACLNIGSLLLARALEREREMAVRVALGARRAHLLRQLLVESAVLATIGGAAGLLLTAWGTDVLAVFLPQRLPSPRNDYAQLGEFATPAIDGSVLLFALGISAGAAVVFGLSPAVLLSRRGLARELQSAARPSSGGSLRVRRGLGALVVLETALSWVLLAGAGLTLTSLERLHSLELGFNPENVLTFWLKPPANEVSPEEAPAFIERVLERVRAVPGVLSASVNRCTPFMSTCARTSLRLAEEPPPPSGRDPAVGRHYVGADYFETLGIPLRHGRAFNAGDRADSAPVAVVNETAARRFWPDADPIGRRVRFGRDEFKQGVEIVGIVGDVRYGPPEEPAAPDFYTPFAQFTYPDTIYFVRARRNAEALAPELRAAIRSVEPEVPLYDVKTLDARLGAALSRPRFHTTLFTGFAATALLLVGIGIYGVMAHSVSERRHEIGVRMALGADARRVVLLALGRGLGLTLVGAALGLPAALAAGRALEGLLYGVSPADPLTFGVVLRLMGAVALAAAWAPARRAAAVDPLVALRVE
jgi:predicted permease